MRACTSHTTRGTATAGSLVKVDWHLFPGMVRHERDPYWYSPIRSIKYQVVVHR